ncbi:hypothetical protein EGW08_010321 [Elysia chlorotica]|uniref:Uncharacterized protein n=1 Tax=Elysia chlorotica TaxID=188477 RepID=A0A3S1BJ09_ELYCH|nr:hypothetical protein EGW08_010321 [Elysia chlorotica]
MLADPPSDSLAAWRAVVGVVGQTVDIAGDLARADLEVGVSATLELHAPVLEVVVVFAGQAGDGGVGWAQVERPGVEVVGPTAPLAGGVRVAVVFRPAAREVPAPVGSVGAKVAVYRAEELALWALEVHGGVPVILVVDVAVRPGRLDGEGRGSQEHERGRRHGGLLANSGKWGDGGQEWS